MNKKENIYSLNKRLLVEGKKWCSAGKHVVEIGEFSKDAGRSKDGLGGVCLACAKIQSKKYMSRLHARRKEAGRCIHCNHRRCHCNHVRIAAMAKLNKAVRTGEIIKPSTCPKCGREGRICGHIYDIKNPLEVDWLCNRCLLEKYPRKRRKKSPCPPAEEGV